MDTLKEFPFAFLHHVQGTLGSDGVFTIEQEMTNTDSVKEMPLAFGLHPYHPVPRNERKDITFDFPGGAVFAERAEDWMNGVAVAIDNPGTPMRVQIPRLGTIELIASPEYQRIQIWSAKDADFFCIEPIMRDEKGLSDNPQILKPGETYRATYSMKLVQ